MTLSYGHRALALLAAVSVGIGAIYLLNARHGSNASALPFAPHVRVPADAPISPSTPRDHSFIVQVPDAKPATFLASREETIRQGDVVEVKVTTNRPGFVIVHGLSNAQSIDASNPVSVTFRAIYSGRFALHFHGEGGAHFEVLAFNIMPGRGSASSNPPAQMDMRHMDMSHMDMKHMDMSHANKGQ